MYDTYKVNKGVSAVELSDIEIKASEFKTVGEFVDFFDNTGGVIFRIRADQVYTIERLDKGN